MPLLSSQEHLIHGVHRFFIRWRQRGPNQSMERYGDDGDRWAIQFSGGPMDRIPHSGLHCGYRRLEQAPWQIPQESTIFFVNSKQNDERKIRSCRSLGGNA